MIEEDKKKKTIKDIFENRVHSGQFDRFEEMDGRGTTKSGFGRCSTCERFSYAASQFAVVIAMCNYFKMHLNAATPITECSNYAEMGRMGLYEMTEIAYFIDDNKKDPIGFNGRTEDGRE